MHDGDVCDGGFVVLHFRNKLTNLSRAPLRHQQVRRQQPHNKFFRSGRANVFHRGQSCCCFLLTSQPLNVRQAGVCLIGMLLNERGQCSRGTVGGAIAEQHSEFTKQQVEVVRIVLAGFA